MKKKTRFITKQAVKYIVLILMAIGLVIFYSLIMALSTTNKIIVFSVILGMVLFSLIIDLISYKDILGVFGK